MAALGNPRNGRFEPGEQVSPAGEALQAVPAFNPAGRWPMNTIAPWVIAWTGRPLGAGAPVTEALHVSTPLCPPPPGQADMDCALR